MEELRFLFNNIFIDNFNKSYIDFISEYSKVDNGLPHLDACNLDGYHYSFEYSGHLTGCLGDGREDVSHCDVAF